MALAEYKLGDRTYQFDTESVPEGAEPVNSKTPAAKQAVKPANKMRTPANKEGTANGH